MSLIESINLLLEKGEYIDGLQEKVSDIRKAYDALSDADKKVVKNYSKLTQAEGDLKKVDEVHTKYEPAGAMKQRAKHGKLPMVSFLKD